MNLDNIDIRELNLKNIDEIESFCRLNWATFVEVDNAKKMSDEEFEDIARKTQKAMLLGK